MWFLSPDCTVTDIWLYQFVLPPAAYEGRDCSRSSLKLGIFHLFFFFLILTILVSLKYFKLCIALWVLIYIFFMRNEVKYLSICLLVILTSSFVNYLFKSFAHFSIGLLSFSYWFMRLYILDISLLDILP